MLLYGCERPGTDEEVWNCGDMAVSDPGKRTGPVCRGSSKVGDATGHRRGDAQVRSYGATLQVRSYGATLQVRSYGRRYRSGHTG